MALPSVPPNALFCIFTERSRRQQFTRISFVPVGTAHWLDKCPAVRPQEALYSVHIEGPYAHKRFAEALHEAEACTVLGFDTACEDPTGLDVLLDSLPLKLEGYYYFFEDRMWHEWHPRLAKRVQMFISAVTARLVQLRVARAAAAADRAKKPCAHTKRRRTQTAKQLLDAYAQAAPKKTLDFAAAKNCLEDA